MIQIKVWKVPLSAASVEKVRYDIHLIQDDFIVMTFHNNHTLLNCCQASAYEFQGYLTNTGYQVISMAQFVQSHSGGKALLYEGYKYLKIRDGKECAYFGDARGTRASAQQE